MSEKIDKIKHIIKSSKNIVFFGGAGVSTASGIPDFRSKDGLHNNRGVEFEKYGAEWLLSIDCLQRKPQVFFEFYRQKMDTRHVQPNITHKALSELEKCGKLKAVVTQNIDGLHQIAGSKTVYEVHGNSQDCYCMSCKKPYNWNYVFNSDKVIPNCDCGGIVRPDITLYGEKLDLNTWNSAIDVISSADLLIVAGTSLSVYPASNLVDYFSGKNLILINKGEVDADINATVVFDGDMTEVFDEIYKEYKE